MPLSPAGAQLTFAFEEAYWARGILRVAGVDEAGRGPLAGPVVAAAVVFLEPVAFPGLNDSKKLGAQRRVDLHERLISHPQVLWATGVREAEEIDRLNILRATHAAMGEALGKLGGVHHALVDGLPVPGLSVTHDALVGGDARCASIAAASIIAKVVRDKMMDGWHEHFPQYGFHRHRGYPTHAHLTQLRLHGPSPIHRRSFAPVAAALR